MRNEAKKTAGSLLEIGAVALRPADPFTWASGIRSPIYCDNRLTMGYPDVREEIAEGLSAMVKELYPDAGLIVGTATAGIPHAAWVSGKLGLPMAYVRSSAKKHGKGNQIEGKVSPGERAVVIEDLISTGGSAISAVEALREAGVEVCGVLSIFTYELESGKRNFAEAGVRSDSLTGYSALIKEAYGRGLISAEDQGALENWRKDPESWTPAK